MANFNDWFTHFYRQYRTHQNADLSLDKYWEKYKDKFKKIEIGCSYSPDLVDQLYQKENKYSPSVEEKLRILEVLVKEFGMREIRLGIKWNKSVNKNGEIDFSYYKPYLDYCLSNKVSVCLNVGPIKTFGWPEEYIPLPLINKFLITPGSRVSVNSEISKRSIEYLSYLLEDIKSTYPKKQLSYLQIIQPENEAFNPFGKLKLRLSEEYVEKVIEVISTKFPDKKILLSSSETRDTSKIVKIIKELDRKKVAPAKSFICGINYYYNLPNFIKLPKLGPVDYITFSNFFQRNTVSSNIKNSRKMGYQIEVTEAQFEQWGNAYLSPGNSFHEAKYLLARIAENILDPDEGGLIRLWGFERYAKKKIEKNLTFDHKSNLELIDKINKFSIKTQTKIGK